MQVNNHKQFFSHISNCKNVHLFANGNNKHVCFFLTLFIKDDVMETGGR